jgi:hypothetical protein
MTQSAFMVTAAHRASPMSPVAIMVKTVASLDGVTASILEFARRLESRMTAAAYGENGTLLLIHEMRLGLHYVGAIGP